MADYLTQRQVAQSAVAMVTAAAVDDFDECHRIIYEVLETESADEVLAFVAQAAAEGVKVNAAAAGISVGEALAIIGLRVAGEDLPTEDGS